jgi:2-hydroxy-3-keto-5-methylthiopentenyl-1-phosphate phosphatase
MKADDVHGARERARWRRLLAVLDFDGTITETDCLVPLLERHVPAWPRLAEEARGGRLPPAELIRRAVSLIRIPREQVLAEFAEAAVLRLGFPRFLHEVLGRGGRVVVVSAGFREAIETVWRREGLAPVPVYAGELRRGRDGRLDLEMHPAFGDCPACGRRGCKATVVRALRRQGDVVAAFGDGRRDVCMAREAEVVVARAALARACEREGVPFVLLDDFRSVAEALAERLRSGT